MKKSLIALAIASAVSAPAFAATANVDVYGKLNLGFSVLGDQFQGSPAIPAIGTSPAVAAKPAISDTQVTSFASRIGFKGTEDLGGSLAAIWQIESGINMDEGTGTWGSRNTFLGLKGGWGNLIIGKNDSTLKVIGRSVDLFADTFGDSRNILAVTGAQDIRTNNMVQYNSPSWSGFSFAGQYSTDPLGSATGGDVADNEAYNANAIYAMGPFYAAIAFADGDFNENNGWGTQYRASAGFNIAGFKFVGEYDMVDSEGNGLTPGNILGDFSGYMLGASFTMGNWVMKGDYVNGNYDGTSNLITGVIVDADEPSMWNVGVDYNLSKRTTIYGLYTQGDGTVLLGKGAGDSDVIVPESGSDSPSAFTIGVSHSF